MALLVVAVIVACAVVRIARRESLRNNRPNTASARLDALAGDLAETLSASRHILLAQRPAGDATCITQQLQGNQVVLQGSAEGGPGLRFMAFYNEAPDDPLALFDWSQNRLRPYLESERKANAPVLREVEDLADLARRCAADIRGGSMPASSDTPTAPRDTTAWPAQCMAKLIQAIEEEPNAAAAWAEELAAATAALADLHRWLDVLLQSHLASLEFQASCRDAFEYARANAGLASGHQVSNLPATGTAVTYGQNYLEVERQAEQAFCATPAMTSLALYHDLSDAPAARFIPPEQRGAFLWLRSRLTPARQRVWDLAATSPCAQSRLVAILYRAVLSGTLDAAALVLQRLDRTNPDPSVDEMIDSLFYRAGFNSSGFNWADRYDHRLLDAAGQILGPGDTVIRRARQTVNNLLGGWRNYAGDIMTLKQALDTRRFDCVRGTDLIGAIYRNAGHGRYYIGRLNCGVAGHSVGVVPIEEDGEQRLLVADSLEADLTDHFWPDAYLDGLDWPEGYPGTRGPLFSAELYVPALNGYIFAEGYVTRGKNAGRHLRAPDLPCETDGAEPRQSHGVGAQARAEGRRS